MSHYHPCDLDPCYLSTAPIDLSDIASMVLGGWLDMAVRARATWLAASEGWSWEDEPVEDLTRYEDEARHLP